MRDEPRQERLSTADMAAAGDRGPAAPDARRDDMDGEGRERAAAGPQRGNGTPLFSEQDARELWSRWDTIQTGFVDEPRRAVEDADQLVARVIKHLAQSFADERRHLEEQWSRGGDVSTEDLRVALQRYRSFFDRLLSM
jgi:hypothetical protein